MDIGALKAVLRKKKADFAIIYNIGMDYSPNMLYFTGFSGVGVLIVPAKKPAFLLVPEMEKERAKRGFSYVIGIEEKKMLDTLKAVLKEKGIKARKVALDKSSVTLNFNKALKKSLSNFKTIDISRDLVKIREIKTKKEISTIKKAFSISNSIFISMIKNFKKFKTEADVAAFLHYQALKKGCDVSFPPIVASGSNGSMPHYEPKNATLKKGFCVVDFGIKHNGYCTDMTRTLFIGKPEKKDNDIYNFILKIQNQTIAFIKLNQKCSDVYDFCVKELGKYSKYFTHGLGHGIGVEIHELPNLTLGSKDKIGNNMAFTVEPGIYFPGKFGIRIEDSLIMANGKKEVLTKIPKKLISL